MLVGGMVAVGMVGGGIIAGILGGMIDSGLVGDGMAEGGAVVGGYGMVGGGSCSLWKFALYVVSSLAALTSKENAYLHQA
jgi:hypothetical protein